MTEFECDKCDMKVAEYENGELIVFCCSEQKDKARHLPLEEILAAAVLEKKSLEILLKFCAENPKVKFL